MSAKTQKASGHLWTAGSLLEVMRKLAVQYENGVDGEMLSVAVEHLCMRASGELEKAQRLIVK